MNFDFGPISRTVDASTGKGDAINFASLPIHEALTALLAATNRDEFVAWLWHDIFKALFHWYRKNNWSHLPDTPCVMPKPWEEKFAKVVDVPVGLVATHHPRVYSRCKKLLKQLPNFKYSENSTVTNEFDQVTLGQNARFLQLSFLAEPATNTTLIRAVIADAFMEVVTKATSEAIEKQLASKQPIFRRARYIFDFEQVQMSKQPTDQEINALKGSYDMYSQGDELIVQHITPVISTDFDARHVEVVIDFTNAPPTPGQFAQRVITLVELLTVYQDGRTILMGLPQFLSVDVQQLKQDVQAKAAQHLQALDVLTTAPEAKIKKQSRVTAGRVDWSRLPLMRQGSDIDLLAHVFAEQIQIHLIDKNSLLRQVDIKDDKGRNKKAVVRLLTDIVNWPTEQLQSKSRHCRICGSAFDSILPAGTAATVKAFSSDFTDSEHISFGGDICPMCRIYTLNSHQFTQAEKAKGSTGMRKAYRGAFALLMPSSHFTYRDDQGILLEQPPLDIGGRFSGALQRATFTSQEFVLFNALSRRIIGEVWQRLNDGDGTRPLPLPYLGAILLTQDKAQDVRKLFDHLEVLFSKVELCVYPFKATIQPAVELAFEMTINDLQKHHTKHTYLKSNPITVTVSPKSKFMLLVDNGLQLEVSSQFFADQKRIEELLSGSKGLKRRRNWLLSVLGGNDPATATAEVFYDQATFWHAENTFWATQVGHGSPAEQWQAYEEVRKEIKQIMSRYPLLIEFFANPRR